ncbi:MAG: class E sortase [Actinobacteria bacterium]|nr:class E sortase [Actinomycetota bacterium]
MLGGGRARPAVGLVVLGTVAVVLILGACGSEPTATIAAPGTLTAPPSLPRPPRLPLPDEVPETSTTTALAAMPAAEPAFIPGDSYAEEPVTEIGSMEIPKISLAHAIFQGVTLNNIDHGPSHWPGTALPGQRGNTVFAGHRTTRTHPFLRMDELEPGDEVIFRVGGVRSVYRVTGSEVVEPEAVWIADQTSDATGTLYACHPPGSASYRYVVKLALAGQGPDVQG